MAQQSSRCGYQHIGTKPHAFQFLFVSSTVVAAINGHRTHTVEVIAETLHRLVDLLGQFAGGRHDDAVDGILWIVAIVEHREDGQQIGCRLTGSRLCDSQHVVAVENLWDTTFLDRGHVLEMHVVEGIEDVIVQICFFKFHEINCLLVRRLSVTEVRNEYIEDVWNPRSQHRRRICIDGKGGTDGLQQDIGKR